MTACLRGLIITDGSIYQDRGYTMVNISTNIPDLADDILLISDKLGFAVSHSKTSQPSGKPKHTERFVKNIDRLLSTLSISEKS